MILPLTGRGLAKLPSRRIWTDDAQKLPKSQIDCLKFAIWQREVRYGSGDKVTQNVVGGIGVVQGNGGDLRIGLPRQSLFTDDGLPFHVPQRLLTVVLAPFARVEQVVQSSDILARLFGNGWVNLVVIDPHTGKALKWRRIDEPGAAAFTPPTHQNPETRP